MRSKPTLSVVLVVLAVSGCGARDNPDSAGPSTTVRQTAPPITPSTTGAPEVPPGTNEQLPAELNYYRCGEDGLFAVTPSGEEQLVSEPVACLGDDFMGGVVYRYRDDAWLQPAWRLAHGSMSAEPLPFAGGYTGVLGGRPVLVTEQATSVVGFCEPEWETAQLAMDLSTGELELVQCKGIEEDGGVYSESVAGGIFLGVQDVAFGASHTDLWIVAWDRNGDRLELQYNPFPEECAPCELSAHLSPDGRLLAYTHRADAKWPPDVWDQPEDEEWRQQSRSIPGELVVIDLETGSEVYRADQPPFTSIVDFDGRYVVMWGGDRDRVLFVIVDTADGEEPVTVEGQVVLAREPVLAAPTADVLPPMLVADYPYFYATVENSVTVFSGWTEPGAEVVAAGRYPVAVGEDGSWSIVLHLQPGSNVASFDATDAAGNKTQLRVPVFYDPLFESMIGTWEGGATVPSAWLPIGKVRFEFRADGTYSARALDGELPALYYGTDADSPLKAFDVWVGYNVWAESDGPHLGQIDVVFDGAQESLLGLLEDIRVSDDGRKLTFQFWRAWAGRYGPILYDLERIPG